VDQSEVVEVGDSLGHRRHEPGGTLDRHGSECLQRMGPDEPGAQHHTVVVAVAVDQLHDSGVTGCSEHIGFVDETAGVGVVTGPFTSDQPAIDLDCGHPGAHGSEPYRKY
jgi:hypothetical protein